ncbi:MAG: response regulator [Paenibacillaceae bacterium]|nr:response regulator [Paenibacillaceae bacterium]
MYHLIIVDDEIEIRDGLAAFAWETLGIVPEGKFAHGLDALQYVSAHPVDIVLTDIRMPFMDGVELMEQLRRRHPYVQVVVLSGYNDFDYAKKALQNGAADYLLKPTSFAALADTFRRLTAKLDAGKQEEQRKAALERKGYLLAKLLRDEFLQRLFAAEPDADEFETGCAEGELLLEAGSGPYAALTLELDRLTLAKAPVSDKELRLFAFALDNILQDLWDGSGAGYHVVDKHTAVCRLLALRPDAAERAAEAVKEQLARFMGLFRSTVSVGIGFPVEQATGLHKSAAAADRLMAGRTEGDALLAAGPQETSGDRAAGQERRETPEQAAAPAPRKENALLAAAKRYIEANYHRSMTLKEAAQALYVTPGHLSALFRETGESYLQYVTGVRMGKAMELLTDLRYKIYDIVELVGYSDPSYFTEVFKRHTGLTPAEFRNRSPQ